MAEKKIKIDYAGSLGWLIFWAVIFFPVAFVLLATSGKFELNNRSYFIRYDGNRNWLCFWVIFGFPIAVLLLVLNGVALVTDDGTGISGQASNPIIQS